MNHATIIVLALALVALGGVSSHASASFLIGGTSYVETGGTESMSASFLAPDGGISTGTYSGLIKLKVSGVGESLATQLNDAFYVYTDGAHNPIAPTHNGSYYQLAFDTTTLVAFNPSQNAKNFIRYDVDAGTEVTPAYVPGYRSDHTYTVILDTGTASASLLHFGVSNGNFADNSGSYSLELTQLSPVPEPSSLGLLAVVGGIVAVGARFRRRRS